MISMKPETLAWNETSGVFVEGVDYVLHQASLGSVPRSMKTPLVSFQANVSGFM